MGMQLRVGPALSIAVAGWLFAQGQTEPSLLDLHQTRTGDLPAGGWREHHLLLRAGQYARVAITQHTLDIAVQVFDPTGKQQFVVDNNGIGEAENVELIAATSGNYCLRVTASERNAPAGRYEIAFAERSPETVRYGTRIAAARQVALATAARRL